MYTLIRALSFRQLLSEQVPAITVSLLIAELFYKFHSFSLECLAFLVTWYFADILIQFFSKKLRPNRQRNNSKSVG
ncbi:hypothetical protein N836_14980 [Leptolyngbya sp. Heron Island J]|nr:hypothetical protein N836_14980 [Leptolyngbya sp. Heron Island J]